MATVTETQAFPLQASRDTIKVVWTPLTTTNADGSPFTVAYYKDRSIQVNGTFGVGGSCSIEGSMDGTNYYTLTDPQGNALTFTAAKIEAVSELVLYIRPRVTAGDGTTSLTVSLIAGK